MSPAEILDRLPPGQRTPDVVRAVKRAYIAGYSTAMVDSSRVIGKRDAARAQEQSGYLARLKSFFRQQAG